MNKIESWLRRYRNLIGLISIAFAAIGIWFGWIQLKSLVEEQKRAADEQKRSRWNFFLNSQSSETQMLELLTRYTSNESMGGSAYLIKPTGSQEKRHPSRQAANPDVSANPESAKKLYGTTWESFELNLAGLEAAKASINSLVQEATSGSETDADGKGDPKLRKQRVLNVVAPVLRARSRSFDPTEVASALTLSAFVVNGHLRNESDLQKQTHLQYAFRNRFVGMTNFKDQPKDFSDFDFTGTVFAGSSFLKSEYQPLDDGTPDPPTVKAVNPSFARCKLAHADFSGCKLDDVDFTGAIALADKDFTPGKPQSLSVDFTEASLRRCKASTAHRANEAITTQLNRANFFNAEMSGCEISNATFQAANFNGLESLPPGATRKRIENCTFTDCSFEDATFKSAELEKVKFIRCLLNRADFTNAVVKGCTFDDCDLQDTMLTAKDMEGTTFSGATGSAPARKAWRAIFGESPPSQFKNMDLSGAFLAKLKGQKDMALFRQNTRLDWAWLPSTAFGSASDFKEQEAGFTLTLDSENVGSAARGRAAILGFDDTKKLAKIVLRKPTGAGYNVSTQKSALEDNLKRFIDVKESPTFTELKMEIFKDRGVAADIVTTWLTNRHLGYQPTNGLQ
jgi:uncharacterized protein YjbI with pentapeptide repeats